MKKTIISILLVLITCSLFVACSSCPEETETAYSMIITVSGLTGESAGWNGKYYLNGDLKEQSESMYVLYSDEACTKIAMAVIEEEPAEANIEFVAGDEPSSFDAPFASCTIIPVDIIDSVTDTINFKIGEGTTTVGNFTFTFEVVKDISLVYVTIG